MSNMTTSADRISATTDLEQIEDNATDQVNQMTVCQLLDTFDDMPAVLSEMSDIARAEYYSAHRKLAAAALVEAQS